MPMRNDMPLSLSPQTTYHLGNIREVVNEDEYISQVTNYYPFGAPYADATASKGAAVQPYKYNGKELDLMHGLNTYDYGARQHDPILARLDRIDPLCEKYYSTSPYAYCANNPVMLVDFDGCKPDSLCAALMSAIAYNDKNYKEYAKQLKNTNSGWEQCHTYSSLTGFKSALFQRQKDDGKYEYCLAYAGTDDIKDAITDVLNYLDIPTLQYAESLGAALGASDDYELTFTGHSLGGGLATLASIATGNDAIIFNPASIGPCMKSVAKTMAFFRGSGKSNITQYRPLTDPVSSFQDNAKRPSAGNIRYVNTGKRYSHSINDIINAFSKK